MSCVTDVLYITDVLCITDILTGVPVTSSNFNMKYMTLLPWELIAIIWNYLPATVKIRTKKEYYERYHYLITPTIRNFDVYMDYIIKSKHKYLYQIIIKENYNNWVDNRQYYHMSGMFDSYITYLLSRCDIYKNVEFKNILLRTKKTVKRREIYKELPIINIWTADTLK